VTTALVDTCCDVKDFAQFAWSYLRRALLLLCGHCAAAAAAAAYARALHLGCARDVKIRVNVAGSITLLRNCYRQTALETIRSMYTESNDILHSIVIIKTFMSRCYRAV